MSQLTDTATRTDGWPIGSAPTDYVLSGVRAVLPDVPFLCYFPRAVRTAPGDPAERKDRR